MAELRLSADVRDQQERRIRRPGGGRKPLTETDSELLIDLESLVEPTTRGHPESALRWTSKSTRHLAEELTRQGHRIGRETVASLLKEAGYSLQAEHKTREGQSHPDRDGQFRHINDLVHTRMDRNRPTISVDTKKKELLGDFANGGREWRPQGRPEEVRTHDFMDKTLGKAIPYGVYDILNNRGFVSVGVDHDTSEFAVHGIRRWWTRIGSRKFPRASDLLITADGGGSNSSRSRLWKVCLQGLADDLGIGLVVCHFPPGTSKWNKIEHRLFSFIRRRNAHRLASGASGEQGRRRGGAGDGRGDRRFAGGTHLALGQRHLERSPWAGILAHHPIHPRQRRGAGCAACPCRA
jgi:hypothetical protein